MAELVDALVSGTSVHADVEVRVLFRARFNCLPRKDIYSFLSLIKKEVFGSVTTYVTNCRRELCIRYKEEFTVFPRKCKKNHVIFYYRTYDEDGNRTTPRSTGQTSKSAAKAYCKKLKRKGLLMPTKDISFETYAQGWWEYDTCPYIQGKLSRGYSFSKNHASIRKGILKNHILPYFGKKLLKNIKAADIEKWVLNFVKKGYSSSATNNTLQVLKIMLSEAERLGYISINPAKQVEPIKNAVKERKLITAEEVKSIFGKEFNPEIWDSHLSYTANLLAITSGMRLGEIQGLQVEDVHDSYVHVRQSLERGGYGLKDTKTHEERMIPLPAQTLSALRKLINDNKEGFIFSLNGGKEPIAPTTITKPLYRALKAIGISEEKRKERTLTFHMWRHYFNSRLRSAGVPDSKIQLLTGHRTMEMVQHYTHFIAEDFSDILQANMW